MGLWRSWREFKRAARQGKTAGRPLTFRRGRSYSDRKSKRKGAKWRESLSMRATGAWSPAPSMRGGGRKMTTSGWRWPLEIYWRKMGSRWCIRAPRTCTTALWRRRRSETSRERISLFPFTATRCRCLGAPRGWRALYTVWKARRCAWRRTLTARWHGWDLQTWGSRNGQT